MEQNFNETDGTDKATPGVGATIASIGHDKQLFDYLTHHRKHPPHDIWQVLATQQFRQEQQVMQHSVK